MPFSTSSRPWPTPTPPTADASASWPSTDAHRYHDENNPLLFEMPEALNLLAERWGLPRVEWEPEEGEKT